MSSRARLAPNITKVLVITAAWTLLLVLVYLSEYGLVDDLIGLGKLSGSYAFWPDLAGNVVIGVVGGLLGGSLLVFKVNAGYRHKTFVSGILRSVAIFLLVYLSLGVFLLFAMAFSANVLRAGAAEAVSAGWTNVMVNMCTPSFLATTLLIGLIVSGTQFMLQVNDKFGPGVLWKLLTGKYYRPREEERVFMFLDLRSSTQIAESLGHTRFFEFLRELFQDVTEPVVDSRGEIYQYVGDEVVITWPVERGLDDANCIACYFRIERALDRRTPQYRDRFGVEPRFKAGVHLGEATVGEIGVVKKDIVYSGDVLNTTSRIQEECKRYGVDLLASRELLERLRLGPAYEASHIGEIQLRGKTRALGLSAVRPSEGQLSTWD